MKHFILTSLFLFAALLTVPATIPSAAQAQVADHHTVPLAVIRFNQPRVYFSRPLSNAVRHALQVGPQVRFHVMHYRPDSAYRKEKAERNLQAVLKQLNSIGVGPDKIQVNRQVMAGLPHSEVHVYVR